ncbi:MAG TPA: hypothetical protein VK116_10240 [Planctomycetota bacterium]|nr:hypothetical protein [Planctomycetota bacterium]
MKRPYALGAKLMLLLAWGASSPLASLRAQEAGSSERDADASPRGTQTEPLDGVSTNGSHASVSSHASPEELILDLVDKSAIARQEARRLRGYRELGNPHIPEGFLLRKAEPDPELSRVDPEELRRRSIALVEGRRAYSPPSSRAETEVRSQTSPSATDAEDVPDSMDRPARRGPHPGLILAVAAVGGVLLVLARRLVRRARSGARS